MGCNQGARSPRFALSRVGYLIAWRNPTVKLKDGSSSAGKRVLIDSQQRVAALMAALLGQQVATKDYEKVRIRIAFNPLANQPFKVSDVTTDKNPSSSSTSMSSSRSATG